MQKCPKCNGQLREAEDVMICESCGAKFRIKEKEIKQAAPTTKVSKKAIILAAIIAILIAAIVLLSGYIIYQKTQEPDTLPTQQELVDTRPGADKKENPIMGRNVFFVGLEDKTIAPGEAIYLENVASNEDFVMKFEVKDLDTGNIVFTTDLIPSGKMVEWIPSENLSAGAHRLAVLQSPYYIAEDGSKTPLTAGNNEVTLTIE